MKASIGDHLVVRSNQVGQPMREAEIIETRGSDGGPPFVVRWQGDGHTGLIFPGPDAIIKPARLTND